MFNFIALRVRVLLKAEHEIFSREEFIEIFDSVLVILYLRSQKLEWINNIRRKLSGKVAEMAVLN